MAQHEHERESEPAPETGRGGSLVAVTVSRSGGIAGMTRRWAVQISRDADAVAWMALVEACPWEQPQNIEPANGNDRFSWSVHATLPDASRRVDLTEAQVCGPWRALIDAVREASAPPPDNPPAP